MNRTTTQMELKIGTAKVDITPPFPVSLAGYTHYNGVFSGISERLNLRFLYLEQHLESQIAGKILIVSADLIWWGPDRVERIYQELNRRFGLEPSSILLHATHSHSGPQTSEVLGYGIPNREYIEFLEAKLFEGAAMAMQKPEQVTVERGSGACTLGIYRRKQVDGQILFAPNEEGPADPEVSVISFRTVTGNQIKALLVHYACHPTTKANDRISCEFPGVAMNRLEQALGSHTTALFLQGCSADIRPALVKDGWFYRGSEEDIERLAERLTSEVLTILQSSLTALPLCEMTAHKLDIALPFHFSRGEQRSEDREPASGILEMTLLSIAEGLSILAMNAEISVEYGLWMKERYNKEVLPVPYSNGMIGYVMTARQIEEGGYEPAVSYPNFGLPAPFNSRIEQIIYEGIEQITRKRGKGHE